MREVPALILLFQHLWKEESIWSISYTVTLKFNLDLCTATNIRRKTGIKVKAPNMADQDLNLLLLEIKNLSYKSEATTPLSNLYVVSELRW